ncbi:MAG: transcriptional repressor [Bacteroidota bacterium]
MEKQSVSLLKKYGLRVTLVRDKVLELFLASAKTALSNADIEKHFERIDRITLYRTLRTFEKKGLIHQVFDNSGIPKYAAGSEKQLEQKHNDEHVHFHCVKCEKTVCLENTVLPNVKTPEGFQIEERHLVLSGTCDSCSEEMG